jgi:hypothetical protein
MLFLKIFSDKDKELRVTIDDNYVSFLFVHWKRKDNWAGEGMTAGDELLNL